MPDEPNTTEPSPASPAAPSADATVGASGDVAADAAAGTPGAAADAAASTPDAVPAADATADADPTATADPTPTRTKRRLAWLWWTLAGLAAAGLVGLTVYMGVVTAGWRAYATDLESALEDVRATAAQDRADTEAMDNRLQVVQSQLDTANERITDLANEEANAVDTQDVLKNMVETMMYCADQRQAIIDVLTDRTLYFRGTTPAAVERETNAICDDAKAAYYDYFGDGS